jgi:RNA polymerase sigma factor (sigma-70 family)
MSTTESVTGWVAGLKQGDESAIYELWNRYSQRVVGVARKKLGPSPRRYADEEDVAISVFMSLYNGAAQGRFPHLDDRNDLWRILVMLTQQKSVDQLRQQVRLKRGGGLVKGDSAFAALGDSAATNGIEQVVSTEPSAELLQSMDEEFQRLLRLLRNDSLRQVALLRLEGDSNEDIADRLGVTQRAVERKFQLIRETWVKEVSVPITETS